METGCFGNAPPSIHRTEIQGATIPEPNRHEEAMKRIEPEMRVATVVDRHPETVSVFLDYDCPKCGLDFPPDVPDDEHPGRRLGPRHPGRRVGSGAQQGRGPNGVAGGESEDEA